MAENALLQNYDEKRILQKCHFNLFRKFRRQIYLTKKNLSKYKSINLNCY